MLSLRSAMFVGALVLCSMPSAFAIAVHGLFTPPIGISVAIHRRGLVNFPDVALATRSEQAAPRALVGHHRLPPSRASTLPYPSWFADEDGDGFGAGPPFHGPPRVGWVTNREDCAPNDARLPVMRWRDLDADGYGDPATGRLACTPRRGWADNDRDCDDTDDTTPTLVWLDLDRDGLGRSGTEIEACEPLPLHVPRHGDCDDDDPRVRTCP